MNTNSFVNILFIILLLLVVVFDGVNTAKKIKRNRNRAKDPQRVGPANDKAQDITLTCKFFLSLLYIYVHFILFRNTCFFFY